MRSTILPWGWKVSPDDCDVIERYATDIAKSLDISRPPAMYVIGADRVDIDLSSRYNDGADIDAFVESLSQALARDGYVWDVWRLGTKFVSVSEKEKGYE